MNVLGRWLGVLVSSLVLFCISAPALTTAPVSVAPAVEQTLHAYDADAVRINPCNALWAAEASGHPARIFSPLAGLVAARGGTPLYRAVTAAELNAIKQTGTFSVVPGSSTPLPGVQGKWFYDSLENANTWARQAAAVDGGPLTIIRTSVPKSAGPAYSQPWVDGIRDPAMFYDLGTLNAPIKVLSGTIP